MIKLGTKVRFKNNYPFGGEWIVKNRIGNLLSIAKEGVYLMAYPDELEEVVRIGTGFIPRGLRWS